MADINPDELTEKVGQVLDGQYWLVERFLLKLQIIQNTTNNNTDNALTQILHEDIALNDIVLHAGKSVHTIDFKLKINNKDVYRQHADGLIVRNTHRLNRLRTVSRWADYSPNIRRHLFGTHASTHAI